MGARRLGDRLPCRAADRPRHDVLEPAEDGAPPAGEVVGAEAVAELDARPAPGAAVAVHQIPRAAGTGDRRPRARPARPRVRRSSAAARGRAWGNRRSPRCARRAARASASTTSARCATVPIGASSSPCSRSIPSADGGARPDVGQRGGRAALGRLCRRAVRRSPRARARTARSRLGGAVSPSSSSSTTRAAPERSMNARTVATARPRSATAGMVAPGQKSARASAVLTAASATMPAAAGARAGRGPRPPSRRAGRRTPAPGRGCRAPRTRPARRAATARRAR